MRMLTPYWTPRSLASDLFSDWNRLFDDSDHQVTGPSRPVDERSFAPACEITEGDDHYLMSMDIPGMKKSDIKIEMNENVLTVSGERKRLEKTEEANKAQRFEKSYGFFKRSFSLPNTLDAEKIEAQYEDGVLELYLPKAPAAKSRQIQIQ